MMRLLSPLLLLLELSVVGGEIRQFDGLIEADSTYIHYSEGFIVAPGSIDLSALSFTTLDDEEDYNPEDRLPPDSERSPDQDEDEPDLDNDNDNTDVPGTAKGDGGGNRLRYLSDKTPGSTVDIVFFHEPSGCSNSRTGCDWTALGIGASKTDDTGSDGVRWCCSNDAIDFGYCEGGDNEYGRLIVNKTIFSGQHRFIEVPESGKLEASVHYGELEEQKNSGKYILVIANCNDEGRDVYVSGKYTWKSVHGYLPGDIFGEMYFFAVLTILYMGLAIWYGVTMKIYEDSSIPIQKWILGTIILGLLETFFRTGDYIVWNQDGYRFWFAMYTGVLVGVIKRALSRCLVVMVSLGWGVVRDRLDHMKQIIFLGVCYVGFAAARDIMTIVAVTENQTLSIDEEKELFDVVTVLTFIVAAIDVTFYMWILDALNGTMQYLENMNQKIKLLRYLRLRCILLFSILFAVMWSVFSLVNTYMDESILEEQNEWSVNALMELNYLAVLVGVAWLWKPDPNAKDLAYVMELPALGGEDNELEMTESIPSALDDDDDYEDKLQVTNGVAT